MADVITRLKLESGEYDAKIRRAVTGLQQMEAGCRKVGGSLAVLEQDQKDYVQSLGRMETVSTSVRGKIGELTNAYTELAAQYRRLTAEEKNGDFGRALNASLQQLKQRIADSKKELNDINKELGEVGTKGLDLSSVMQTLGSKFGISSESLGMLTTGTVAYTAVLGGLTTAVIAGTKAWADYNAELAKQDQITTVTTGLKGPDANRMTDFARSLVDTYNVDFRETINAANTLMTQFGATGEQAIQLLRDGMQGMIQGDGPKLLQMIQQYAPAFRDAGVSASQLVAVIQNSEGGIFTDQNMNAIVMGIKNIRLMTKPTSDALAQLGIDGQKMSQQLSDGTLTIFDALKQVATAIQGVDSNSKAAGEVMQQVFGRQGAMAGTKLGEAIATLNTNLEETKRQTGEVGKAYDELYQANLRLNTAIRDCFEYDGWDQMATGIKAKLVGALSDVLEVAGNVKSIFDEVKNADISEGVSKSTPRAVRELEQLAELADVLWKRIRGEGGGGKGIGTSDIDKRLQYISNGADKQEREKRYDAAIDELRRKLNNIGKERKVTNADGSTSYKIDSQEVQDQKRAALERRIAILEERRDSVVNRPDPTPTKPIKPISPTKPTGGKPTISFADDSIMAQEKLISDLTQKWKTASGELRDGYLKQLDEAKAKLKEMTADPLKELEIEFENKFETGSVSPAQAFIDRIRGDLAQANLDDDMATFSQIMTNALKGGIEDTDLSGISEDLFRRMLDGENIPDEVWDELKEYIQEKIPGLFPSAEGGSGGNNDSDKKNNPLLHADKNGTQYAKVNELLGSISSGMSNVVGGLERLGVDIPNGIKDVLGGMQAISSILTGIAATVIAIEAISGADAIIPFASGGIVPKFANGGLIGRAAAGMMIPGNSMSGDRLRLPVDGGRGMIGVNSGELILNRAQQGVIAQELEGGGFNNIQLEAAIGAEEIMLVANNRGNRTQRGEYVQSNNRRG